MSTTVDVNVLVYASDESSERHTRAKDLVAHIASSSSITYLFWPVLIGYLRIVTHPSILERPLAPTEALENVDNLVSRPQIRAPGEGDRFWDSFKSAARAAVPRGDVVPDVHLAALMHEHGVSRIWTGDRGFRRFEGVTVLDPFHARFASGFGA